MGRAVYRNQRGMGRFQRIKGLSLRGVVGHFLAKTFRFRKGSDIAQKQTQTSLIEKFLYPKLGPGQLWEHAADLVKPQRAARSNMESRWIVSMSAIIA